MKQWRGTLMALSALFALSSSAQVPSLINYQGRLVSGTNLYSGSTTIVFRLCSSLGGADVQYVETQTVTVVDGLYSTRFGGIPDYGTLAAALTNQPLFLEVQIGGTALTPRERVAAVAYAITAEGVEPGAITSSMLADDAVTSNKIANNTITGPKIANNSLTSDDLAAGAVDTDELVDGAVTSWKLQDGGYWRLAGNAGTTNGTHFLGTTDEQALEVRVNQQRALRVQPNGNYTPNLIGGSVGNTVSNLAMGAVIGGGGTAPFPNRVPDSYGFVGGGLGNMAGDGDGDLNSASYAAVAGGKGNWAAGACDFIGGGSNNVTADGYSCNVLAGGRENRMTGTWSSVISGGRGNVIRNGGEGGNAIGGGWFNAISNNSGINEMSVIGGGFSNNLTDAADSVIGGGHQNRILSGAYSAIGGGVGNEILVNSTYASIAGGRENTVGSGSSYAVIAGGRSNAVGFDADYAAIGGGRENTAGGVGSLVAAGAYNQAGADYASVAGGQSNRVFGDSASIGGGMMNSIESVCSNAVIAGGAYNEIGKDSSCSVIAGGWGNTIGTNSSYSVIAGGLQQTIGSNCYASAILGGYAHRIGSNSTCAVIAGGEQNRIRADNAFIGAGGGFTIEQGAEGSAIGGGNVSPGVLSFSGIGRDSYSSFMGGGKGNDIGQDSPCSFIGAGVAGGIGMNSPNGMIPGGRQCKVGDNAPASFAAGTKAEALHPGTFVWADSTDTNFVSTSSNQFLVRAAGGVFLDTYQQGVSGSAVAGLPHQLVLGGEYNQGANLDGVKLWIGGYDNEGATNYPIYVENENNEVAFFLKAKTPSASTIAYFGGNVGVGVSQPTNRIHVAGGAQCDGATWLNASDRNLKTNLRPVNPAEVLDQVSRLPVYSWNYREVHPESRHIGPMAQDFYSVFAVGDNDTTISTVDPAGVSLAAIQGLYAMVKDLQAENESLKKDLADLRARLPDGRPGQP